MKNLKIKDFVTIALLTALYMVFYFMAMMIIVFLGPFGHAISPGIEGMLAGSIIYFMSRKVGKMWQFTIMTGIIMLIFQLMGGGYWIWILTSMITAFIGDVIASRKEKPAVIKLAIASGLMHMGQAWGAIIPSWFFVEKYRADWIARGQSAADMDAMIKYTSGTMGILASVVTFGLAFIGVYIGYMILRKHLKEKN